MAPKRAGKAAGAAAKKARTADPAAKRCAEAVKGLQDCDLSKEALRMLSTMLEICLLERKGQRHRFQQQVVEMAGEALAAAEAKMVAAVEEVIKEHARSEELKNALEVKVNEAKDEAEAKAKVTEQQKRALAEVAKTYQSAKAAVKQAEVDKKGREVEVEAVQGKKGKLQASQDELIKPLVEGVEDAEQRTELVEKLRKALVSFHFDDSIVVALDNVFGKASTERGSFDAMVITNLHEEVARRVAGCDDELRQAQEADAAEEIRGVDRARKVAETQQQQLQAVDKFTECQAAQQAADAVHQEAKAALKEAEKQVKRSSMDQARCEIRVSSFRDKSLAAFLELRDREEDPVIEAEVAEDEDAASAVPVE